MKPLHVAFTIAVVSLVSVANGGAVMLPLVTKCPPDAVLVGQTCVDKYEASVWQIPAASLNTTAGKSLIKKIKNGKVTLADLTGAGATSPDCPTGFPDNFPYDGNWTPIPGTTPPTPGVYAVSIAGAQPTVCITWFQAEQACALSNKRLLTNQEWQRAAAGTQDPGANDGTTNAKCNTAPSATRNTGLAGTTPGGVDACISSWGVEDMVGNVSEWVADWSDLAPPNRCTDWTSIGMLSGDDYSCFGGDGSTASTRVPGALRRGGGGFGTGDGVFTVEADGPPALTGGLMGFRCGR